jgi:predicted Zn-dependent protease
VKKQQIILISGGIVLLAILLLFGNTIPPTSARKQPVSVASEKPDLNVLTAQIMQQAKAQLAAQQLHYVNQYEDSLSSSNKNNSQKAAQLLASFWGDTLHNTLLEAYYTAAKAKLENSEKSLNFAARLLMNELMADDNPTLQYWVASNAKPVLEQLLTINPNNDSATISLGACYLFGNISDNPMQGIALIKKVLAKDSANVYALITLGQGDMKSGQYEKAIERFKTVVNKNPHHTEAVFRLAEAYEKAGNKKEAIEWYKKAQTLIEVPEAKEAIEKRIQLLQ